MKAISIPDVVAGGIDDSYYPQQNKAALVHNYRYDPQGGWRNDRGWEPLIPYASPIALTASQLTDAQAPCRFLAVWTRHDGSEEYVVQERNGNLFYEFGRFLFKQTKMINKTFFLFLNFFLKFNILY